MAVDNPSYFTIPGGLNAAVGSHKAGRFSLLRRRMRMGNSPSSSLASHETVETSDQSGERYSLPPTTTPSTRLSPRTTSSTTDNIPQGAERYSSPPTSSTSNNRRSSRLVLAGPGLKAPVQTQMLVLGMPRVCDVPPQGPYRSSSDLSASYYNVNNAPPSRRHSFGAYFVRKPASPLTKIPKEGKVDRRTISSNKENSLGRTLDHHLKVGRTAGMEDIIIIWSQRSQAAELWVTYLNTCFEQIRKNRNKPPLKILSICIEDMDEKTPLSPVVESKLRHSRLELVIVCPALLEHVMQHPQCSARLTALLQPSNVLAMLLGLEERSITDQHRAALTSFSRWKKMESVKDRDEKFVSDFLSAAMEILGRNPSQSAATPEKAQFMLLPKKVNQCQKKVVLVLNEACEKNDVVEVTILRNGELTEVTEITRRNPFTLTFRVPEVYLKITALVSVRVTKNGQELGTKQLKCESPLHTMEQLLKTCDQPFDFICQSFNIVPTDRGKLDEYLVKSFQRNVPNNFSLLQSVGLYELPKGSSSLEEYPTLLHWSARFGLEQLSWVLLECPGGDAACELRNVKNQTPAEMAEAAGHARLGNLLCGYMQMAQFSSAYTFLKGMVDNKPEESIVSEDYMNPRPLQDTYQVPPTPRPCIQQQTGYMPMRSPLARQPFKTINSSEPPAEDLSFSREKLLRNSLEEPTEVKKKEVTNNGVEEELIEIINDFKNNVFTISEVESLVNQWRRRNDVQQSFREKQEHLTKLREEYERVQHKMKQEMTDVGRPSPMERIRNFFRGKSKEARETKASRKKEKTNKKRQKDEALASRPPSSLSMLSSSSSSSSGRLSTGSGGSVAESEADRRFYRPPMDNYDIPPNPIAVSVSVPSADQYCNIPTVYHTPHFSQMGTVAEEEKKTVNCYMNLDEECQVLAITEPTDNLPEYVNVDSQPIQLECK